MFFKIDDLKNYAIFTEKHLCGSFFLIMLQARRPATLFKKETPILVLSSEYCEIFKNNFFYRLLL